MTILAITSLCLLAMLCVAIRKLRRADRESLFWRDQATQFAEHVQAAHAQTDRVIKLNMETFDIAKQVPVLQQRLDHIAIICESKEVHQVGLQLGGEPLKEVKRWANWREGK